MKNKLLIISLFVWLGSFGQNVPNTTTFSLTDVTAITGGTSLSAAFTNSVDSYFDPAYKGSKDNLLNFRNYKTCPSVGDSWGGGVVAYLFVSGDPGYVSGQCHGIIAATSDQTNAEWGCGGTVISGADGYLLGTGVQNTIDIMAGCSTTGIAARLCDSYSSGGLTDWFLPSLNELGKLYLNRTSIGGFTADYYWSSTEYSDYRAWSLTFSNGSTDFINKVVTDRVRPIRNF